MTTTSRPSKIRCSYLCRDLLIEHKKECAKTGKYVEAKLSDDRITQLKEHLKEVRERLLDGKHNDEVPS
jgi:rRNA maturation protein Rpf1